MERVNISNFLCRGKYLSFAIKCYLCGETFNRKHGKQPVCCVQDRSSFPTVWFAMQKLYLLLFIFFSFVGDECHNWKARCDSSSTYRWVSCWWKVLKIHIMRLLSSRNSKYNVTRAVKTIHIIVHEIRSLRYHSSVLRSGASFSLYKSLLVNTVNLYLTQLIPAWVGDVRLSKV